MWTCGEYHRWIVRGNHRSTTYRPPSPACSRVHVHAFLPSSGCSQTNRSDQSLEFAYVATAVRMRDRWLRLKGTWTKNSNISLHSVVPFPAAVPCRSPRSFPLLKLVHRTSVSGVYRAYFIGRVVCHCCHRSVPMSTVASKRGRRVRHPG